MAKRKAIIDLTSEQVKIAPSERNTEVLVDIEELVDKNTKDGVLDLSSFSRAVADYNASNHKLPVEAVDGHISTAPVSTYYSDVKNNSFSGRRYINLVCSLCESKMYVKKSEKKEVKGPDGNMIPNPNYGRNYRNCECRASFTWEKNFGEK